MVTKFFALIVAAALNPLVARAPEPQGPIPSNCEFSPRPAMPRVTVAQATPVENESRPLPATRAASSHHIEELQRAVANNDRPAFDTALAGARAAGVATRVYDDLARLWDAQFQSPFFAEGSDAHRIASSYSGYEAAMRRHVFTDATGTKFYPAAESRAFVAQQAGVAAPVTTIRRAQASSVTPPSTRRTSTSTPKTPSRSTQTVARRAPAPSSSPDPSTPRRAAATDPAPVVPPSADSSPAGAPPAAGSLPPATTDTEPVTGTDATVAATATIPTTAPVPSTAAPAGAAPATTSKTRSIVLPALLILIGLGVLIVLFRTAR